MAPPPAWLMAEAAKAATGAAAKVFAEAAAGRRQRSTTGAARRGRAPAAQDAVPPASVGARVGRGQGRSRSLEPTAMGDGPESKAAREVAEALARVGAPQPTDLPELPSSGLEQFDAAAFMEAPVSEVKSEHAEQSPSAAVPSAGVLFGGQATPDPAPTRASFGQAAEEMLTEVVGSALRASGSPRMQAGSEEAHAAEATRQAARQQAEQDIVQQDAGIADVWRKAKEAIQRAMVDKEKAEQRAASLEKDAAAQVERVQSDLHAAEERASSAERATAAAAERAASAERRAADIEERAKARLAGNTLAEAAAEAVGLYAGDGQPDGSRMAAASEAMATAVATLSESVASQTLASDAGSRRAAEQFVSERVGDVWAEADRLTGQCREGIAAADRDIAEAVDRAQASVQSASAAAAHSWAEEQAAGCAAKRHLEESERAAGYAASAVRTASAERIRQLELEAQSCEQAATQALEQAVERARAARERAEAAESEANEKVRAAQAKENERLLLAQRRVEEAENARARAVESLRAELAPRFEAAEKIRAAAAAAAQEVVDPAWAGYRAKETECQEKFEEVRAHTADVIQAGEDADARVKAAEAVATAAVEWGQMVEQRELQLCQEAIDEAEAAAARDLVEVASENAEAIEAARVIELTAAESVDRAHRYEWTQLEEVEKQAVEAQRAVAQKEQAVCDEIHAAIAVGRSAQEKQSEKFETLRLEHEEVLQAAAQRLSELQLSGEAALSQHKEFAQRAAQGAELAERRAAEALKSAEEASRRTLEEWMAELEVAQALADLRRFEAAEAESAAAASERRAAEDADRVRADCHRDMNDAQQRVIAAEEAATQACNEASDAQVAMQERMDAAVNAAKQMALAATVAMAERAQVAEAKATTAEVAAQSQQDSCRQRSQAASQRAARARQEASEAIREARRQADSQIQAEQGRLAMAEEAMARDLEHARQELAICHEISEKSAEKQADALAIAEEAAERERIAEDRLKEAVAAVETARDVLEATTLECAEAEAAAEEEAKETMLLAEAEADARIRAAEQAAARAKRYAESLQQQAVDAEEAATKVEEEGEAAAERARRLAEERVAEATERASTAEGLVQEAMECVQAGERVLSDYFRRVLSGRLPATPFSSARHGTPASASAVHGEQQVMDITAELEAVLEAANVSPATPASSESAFTPCGPQTGLAATPARRSAPGPSESTRTQKRPRTERPSLTEEERPSAALGTPAAACRAPSSLLTATNSGPGWGTLRESVRKSLYARAEALGGRRRQHTADSAAPPRRV